MTEISFIAGRNTICTILEYSLAMSLIKLKIVLSYDVPIMLLDIYVSDLKTQVHTKTCIGMHIASVFIISKNSKQLRYSPIVKG